MSAESLTHGRASVNDSVMPFSVTVKLSAAANAAGALRRTAAAAKRSAMERRISEPPFTPPGLAPHYPSLYTPTQGESADPSQRARTRMVASQPRARESGATRSLGRREGEFFKGGGG